MGEQSKFVTILDWMVTRLGLSGAKLIIYALIYGFSQDEESWFSGSLNYIMKWAGCSRSTAIRTLKELETDGLIAREIRDGKAARYKAMPLVENAEPTPDNLPEKEPDPCQNDTRVKMTPVSKCNGGGVKMTRVYNKEYNNIYYNNNYIGLASEIIDYLNDKLGTRYKPTANCTIKAIKARQKEGNYSLSDYKQVIDKKIRDWINDPKMCKYLRPETLFGYKFESYLNELKPKGAQPGMQTSNERNYSGQELDNILKRRDPLAKYKNKWTSNEREYTQAQLKEKIRDPLEEF